MSLKYDGPLRPFVKRDELIMPEGKAAQFNGYGSTAGSRLHDVLIGGGSDLYEAKQYQAAEMYQGNPNGVFTQSFARYHPHGGRHTVMDGYMPGAHAVAPQQQQLMPSGGSRYVGGVPDMMVGGGVQGYELGVPAMRMGVSIEDIQRMQMYHPANIESTRRTPPMDPVSLQKRKRNRIAQKKYRERKKMETTRVMSELNSQKSQLDKMEQLSQQICDHHTRNAVLSKLEESKNEEIAALKDLLAGLQDASDVTATGSAPDVRSTDRVHTPDLECSEERTIVMDIVGNKFVEDAFADVVRDLKTEVHGHISCERRLPLLLNVVQERLLKADDSPNFHTLRHVPAPAGGEEVKAVVIKCEETDPESEEDNRAMK